MLEALINEFEAIEDPRCVWKVAHRLVDILVIAVCAVIGEAESFEDIALYGRCKQGWLRGFLELRGGIPSHDTFRRVLALIDPERFERCFLDWVRSVFRLDAAPRQIAIDGKTVRRSFDRQNGRSPLHLVSAYATEHGLTLAQRATDGKGGELGVLPELLDGLDLRGCLVSLDALACRPMSPSRSRRAAATTCLRSRPTGRRPTRRCRTGSRPKPSAAMHLCGPASMPLTKAMAVWSAGASSPARIRVPYPSWRAGRA